MIAMYVAQCLGEGSYCHVYHIGRRAKAAATKIFTSTNIHGIRFGLFLNFVSKFCITNY